MQTEHKPWTVVVVVLGLTAAACSNAETTGGEARSSDNSAEAVDAPGVNDTTIRVGGVASVTNPLGLQTDELFDGVDAYFRMVNEDGGIHGRQLELVARHDDLLNNEAAVQQLLTQDDVFAVLPVGTLLFGGADELIQASVPTFGWAINPEWEGTTDEPRENLFGQNGSFLCFDCSQPVIPFLADQIQAQDVAVLSYNIPQSSDCATGIERSFEFHAAASSATVVFTDRSLAYGTTDLSVQVAQMKDADVDLVAACMDLQGVVTLAREMNRQSLDAVQYLVNGYDRAMLSEFGDLFQGSYVLTFFAPFEVENPPAGLETYFEWMDRTDAPTTENTMNGWLNAALFVEGLRQAGPNFSRQGVIDAINQMTDWNADGLLAGVDWTSAHTEPTQPVCVALSRIEDQEFMPSFGEPGKPFVCLDREIAGVPEGTPSA